MIWAVFLLALCVLGVLFGLDRVMGRLRRVEQALETSVCAHERHAARNAEFCARLARAEELARKRSHRIRRRVWRVEELFASVRRIARRQLHVSPSFVASEPIKAGDALVQNKDGTVRPVPGSREGLIRRGAIGTVQGTLVTAERKAGGS